MEKILIFRNFEIFGRNAECNLQRKRKRLQLVYAKSLTERWIICGRGTPIFTIDNRR